MANEGDHRVKCVSYRFDVPRKGKFSVDKAKALGLPVIYWSVLQKGEKVEYEGKHILRIWSLARSERGSVYHSVRIQDPLILWLIL